MTSLCALLSDTYGLEPVELALMTASLDEVLESCIEDARDTVVPPAGDSQ